jgi:glycosyltransferase involved in cell wall biosynthesis
VTSELSVTVGIPFLNARRTLPDAVRSVFAQNLTDWELLLMDDGSTDGSLEWARRIDDSRVRVVSDGVNRGLPARLNQIADLARGHLLARMDADDLMHPQRLQRQQAFMRDHPKVDVLDTATVTIDEANRPVGVRGDQPLDCRPEAVLRQGLLIHPAVMGRARWFRANPYDPGFVRAEDRELWMRTCRHSTFARIPEALFFYREGLSGNLRNYLSSATTVRRILRTYGPSAVGRFATGLLLAKSHLKGFTYRMLTRLGLQDRLIRRRTRGLCPAETEAAIRTVRQILATELPGVPEDDHDRPRRRARTAETAPLAHDHGPPDAGVPQPPRGAPQEQGLRGPGDLVPGQRAG